MKTFQSPPRAGAAASPTPLVEEAAPSNAAMQERLRASGGGDWQDQLLAMVQAKGPAPAPARPSAEEQAANDASVASVWRMLFPARAGESDASLARIQAPVIDGPSLDEQARWDAEWAARPEFEHHAPAERASDADPWSWILGRKAP